jgi:hypothetical protein
MMGLLTAIALHNASSASELEVVIYDEFAGGELLLAQDWSAPETRTWPQTFSVGATGSAKVWQATAPAGKWKFCVEFKPTVTATPITNCAIIGSVNVRGLSGSDADGYYVGVSASSFPGHTPGVQADDSDSSGGGGTASSSCSITCSDGSNCSVTCPGTGCSASCNPATCTCG